MNGPVKTKLLCGAAAILTTVAITPAPAQTVESAAENPAAVEAQLEDESDSTDIIVTARRREESLQDVPISITAYSGEALARQGAIDITDISDTTPNVTVETSRGTNSTLTAFIRGIGQSDPLPGFEGGVGIYLDDVYLDRPQGALLDVYDVERIEVLRGPQGTLYGRNTIGGAVKYVTRRLAEDPELRVRATVGTHEQTDLVVSASAPVAPGLKVGGSIARLSRDGFGRNLFLGIENYNKDVWAGRLSAEAEPWQGARFRVSGDYTKDNSAPRNGHRLIPGLISGTPVLKDVYDTRAGLNTPKQDVESWGVALHGDIELNDTVTLRSITAYRAGESATPIDFDASPLVDVDVPAIYSNDQTSQEVQLLYEGDRLQGVIGAYYLDAEASVDFDVILGTTGELLGLPGLNSSTSSEVKTQTWSIFGDFTYEVFDTVSISLGGRYTNDKRTSGIVRRTLIGGASPVLGGGGKPIGPIATFEGSRTFKEFTPRGSIAWKPNEDHNIYFSYSKGFKGGGFDPRGQPTAAPDTDRDGVRDPEEIEEFLSFEPEIVDSYEVGWKASLLDRRLRFSLAAFYADYQDVQIPGSVGVDNNGDGVNETFIGITTNAASARIKGLEFEGHALLARDFGAKGSKLGFTGTLGYIDAEFKKYIDAFGNDVAQVRAIQNTPKWTASGMLDYSVPVGPGLVTASTTVSYRSLTHQFEIPSPFLDQPGYALWDASLVWTSDNDRYSVGLHAKNITGKKHIVSGFSFVTVDPKTGAIVSTVGREGTATAFYGNPRQIYLTFGVRF